MYIQIFIIKLFTYGFTNGNIYYSNVTVLPKKKKIGFSHNVGFHTCFHFSYMYFSFKNIGFIQNFQWYPVYGFISENVYIL